jgi:hypothetical protein
MSITAIVENDTIKLPMHVPDGTRVTIGSEAPRVGLNARVIPVA